MKVTSSTSANGCTVVFQVECSACSIFVRHDQLNRHRRILCPPWYNPPVNSPKRNPTLKSQSSLPQFNTKGTDPQEDFLSIDQHITAKDWVEHAETVSSIYIHIPFCFHKCHYCDFYSISGGEQHYEPFVAQLSRELAVVGESLPSIETIFIGGGTPTIFGEELFGNMLEAVSTNIPRSTSCEWSIEANPETVTAKKAELMNRFGVNRVSIGAQSFDSTLLKTLERWHEIESVENAVRHVKEAGIHNINLDLIYAIPKQTESQLLHDLHRAIALNPTHLSCYSLTYELGTPLRIRLERGEVQTIEHELEASMFEAVQTELCKKGYLQYEISNFAKAGYECAHNIAYWKNKSWWPFGPSASGHVNRRRWKNTPSISQYINGDAMPTVTDVELLSPDDSAGESFMLGLRLLEGMEEAWVHRLIEQSNNRWRESVLHKYIQEGFLHWQSGYLAFTAKGLRFADTVISALLMQEVAITDT